MKKTVNISFYLSFLIIVIISLSFSMCNPYAQNEGQEEYDKLPKNYSQWVELGPAPIGNTECTGRVSAIGVSRTNPNLYYLGGADGGVWKTTDGGKTWTALTDHLPTTAIGAIAVDPKDDQVVYAGSGEANFANHSRYGLGLYKTLDGGKTWQVYGGDNFGGRCFSRILVDPGNSAVVYAAITHAGGLPSFDFNYAAARGHGGALLPLGAWKTIDGGQTWKQLNNNLPAELSATDMALDPENPTVLYVGIGHVFGHPDNGIYKSVDGGSSWVKLGGGLPVEGVGRIALTVSAKNPRRLYTCIVKACDATGDKGETLNVYSSSDGGQTWTARYPGGNIHDTYGWYLNVIQASPINANVVLLGGLSLYKSSDGGLLWKSAQGTQHIDFHALAFDADNRWLSGNDGGIYRSEDQGQTWTPLNGGLGIVQFYAGISLDPDDPRIIYGGTQDNGSLMRTGFSLDSWKQVKGGDGGWTGIKPDDSSTVFVEYQGTGNLFKSTDGGQNFQGANQGIVESDPNCFLPPFNFYPDKPAHMYYATNRFYETTDAGDSWTPISVDLTNGNGAAVRGFAVAPSNPSVLYAGTNDGRILVSSNGGLTWNLVLNEIPGWPRVVRQFAINPGDHLNAYLAVSWFGEDQVLMTQNGGDSWMALDNNLKDIPVNVIGLDPRYNPQIVYIGTDSGVYRSRDGGISWRKFGEGLPNCAINDLRVDLIYNRIIVATQGRGMWKINIDNPE